MIKIRVSAEDKQALTDAAKRAGLDLSVWLSPIRVTGSGCVAGAKMSTARSFRVRNRRRAPSATEVDAYVFIKDNLRTLGWDARNPERTASGQVWTQNECLSNPELKRCLQLDRPENIVKITEKAVWIIEAKRSHGELGKALSEAQEYAKKINESRKLQALFASGVAGNDLDTFLIRSTYFNGKKFVPVQMNSVDVTALLSPDDCALILRTGAANMENPPIDERRFIAKAEQINEILHLGTVNPHHRASVMSALLLSKLSSTGPNVEERSPSILIDDINSRVRGVLRAQGKSEFENLIQISLPATKDNHVKFRQALVDTIQELNNLNILSAMNSGADWLGAFYEVFLKYASWAQDLGIVLTPRHVTTFVADVMNVRANDVVYDPTCGTGGFLVAAFDSVKQSATDAQLANFKKNGVFGIEQDSGVAALAVVNMIFRGDGKNNIHEGNCFAKFLKRSVNNGSGTAKFIGEFSPDPPVTKVMMNPPFALKRSDEKEYKFIDQALLQMQDGATLFSVLPYSAMVRPGKYRTWRRDVLLPRHTLLAVVTFPWDVFYPVGVNSVGVFIRKGVPHDHKSKVLWIRALNDGLLKSKGKRLPNHKATNDFEKVATLLRAFLDNPRFPVKNINQFQKAAPIDFDDPQLELVPEAYLDQAEPDPVSVFATLETAMRDALAYLIKIQESVLRPDLLRNGSKPGFAIPKWNKFIITDIFDLKRGNFHSIANLDEGNYPTISRVSTDNGFVGFYDKPPKAVVWPAGTVTVSTVTGDAFIQPTQFISTDNVVLCLPKKDHQSLRLTSLFFIQGMMNHIKWRYSYGRQCYKTKYAKTEIVLPVKANGTLDEDYMAKLVQAANHWPLVEAGFSQQGHLAFLGKK
jgi:type I restriction-modification system DNA methylase subunit